MNIFKKRCFIVLFTCIFIFSLLIFKIYLIDIKDNSQIVGVFKSQNTSTETTSSINFNILDYNGKQLLKYDLEYYVVINPYTFLRNNSDTNMYDLRALTYTLKSYNSKYDLFNDDIKNENVKLYWKVDEQTYDKINKIKGVNGIYTYVYYKVNADRAADLCSILTNFKDNNGKNKLNDSLEMGIYNKVKDNPYPEKLFQSDSNGDITKVENKNQESNVNVKLTIDKDMNDKVDNVLNDKEFSSYKQIGAIVMESDTGKIRVMSQKDYFKGNINSGIEDGYLFPGSIFKIIVEEAAIESKSIKTSDLFEDDGRYSESGIKATYNLTDAFVVSANEVFMKIGNKTGYNNIFKYANDQGLFQKVLGLNYEQYGILNMDPFSTGDLSLLSIGQKFRITPLEAISIPNTVINNGVYVKPSIIEGYVDENDKFIYKPQIETKNILDKETDSFIKGEMEQVLTSKSGTGRLAYVSGNDVGGKTGTSTRVENKNQKHVDAWFAGFFKIKNKYYSTVILVPDIKNSEEAGNTAAPIFKRIVEELNK
jgi:cell division protein FtsI/penicillin-binding protein 2